MRETRILYHLVAPLDVVVGPDEIARRERFLNDRSQPNVKVSVTVPQRGGDSIESSRDAAIVAPYLLEGLERAEQSGFDAAIIGCFSDPALDAARESLSIPVIGPGIASVHLALQFGERISILTPNRGDPGRSRAFMRSMGLEHFLASVRGVGLSVPQLAAADETAFTKIVDAAAKCVNEDGADVLILGCMSMAFLDPTPELMRRIDLPVINPVLAALNTAEIASALGLRQSRARWPKTIAKPILETKTMSLIRGELS